MLVDGRFMQADVVSFSILAFSLTLQLDSCSILCFSFSTLFNAICLIYWQLLATSLYFDSANFSNGRFTKCWNRWWLGSFFFFLYYKHFRYFNYLQIVRLFITVFTTWYFFLYFDIDWLYSKTENVFWLSS